MYGNNSLNDRIRDTDIRTTQLGIMQLYIIYIEAFTTFIVIHERANYETATTMKNIPRDNL